MRRRHTPPDTLPSALDRPLLQAVLLSDVSGPAAPATAYSGAAHRSYCYSFRGTAHCSAAPPPWPQRRAGGGYHASAAASTRRRSRHSPPRHKLLQPPGRLRALPASGGSRAVGKHHRTLPQQTPLWPPLPPLLTAFILAPKLCPWACAAGGPTTAAPVPRAMHAILQQSLRLGHHPRGACPVTLPPQNPAAGPNRFRK